MDNKDLYNLFFSLKLLESQYKKASEEKNETVKKTDEKINLDDDDIFSLIDLALMTGDKKWFLELTDKLKGDAYVS